ncbi:MAG: 2-oxoglutarate dehydrogenase complex dihydrolipoyllysine-residue succinyltransferase, partial [Pseudomonadota bacterium]|nr:2-oxoglutarate dehydrogenase complex dihydrolipoyllysine-residue succinyltransferase [Pseudomonadota bacterium]
KKEEKKDDKKEEAAKDVQSDDAEPATSPAVRKMIEDHNLDATKIKGSGKDGRIIKEDVQKFLDEGGSVAETPAPEAVKAKPAPAKEQGEREERVKMTKLRKVIASRLKEAQNTAAMLTTFNEVDMTAVMEVRNAYKDKFEKKHGVKLGFMSFFVKAAVNALKEFPAVNAEIDGDEIVYKNFYDIGVAVSTPQGLVVPVVRDCEDKSMATIEKDIMDVGLRARDGKLDMSEMQGGTFTITNGGIFGSMLSTPILNTPQSGILGMHNIVKRAVVMPNGAIEARPMMYLALSYDHRIIDGREAVTFLVRIKDALEDPQRLLLDI